MSVRVSVHEEGNFLPGSNFPSLIWRRTETNSCEGCDFDFIPASSSSLRTVLAGTSIGEGRPRPGWVPQRKFLVLVPV